MNFLSLFVLIPLVMLLGLWLARDVKGVRAVMVTGSSLLSDCQWMISEVIIPILRY